MCCGVAGSEGGEASGRDKSRVHERVTTVVSRADGCVKGFYRSYTL